MFPIKRDRILRFIRRPLEIVLLRYIFGFMVLGPTLMYVGWLASPEHKLEIVLVNKSVPDENRTEHSAINWIFTQERLTSNDGTAYDKNSDYFGFFPRLGGDFVVRDFDQYDSLEIVELVNSTDLVYLADAYGVYSHDYGGDLNQRNRLLYGGLNKSDVAFVQEMRNQNKLVIGEFALFGPPTPHAIRDSMESIFGVGWSGWIGRYFISLDSTANDALPSWVINLYQDKHGPSWPYHDSGVVLVRGSEILILEYGKELNLETPFIETPPVHCEGFGLPEIVNYPFWFDIVSSPHRENQVISIFHLPVNDRGDSLLTAHGIPKLFPAVLREISGEHPFYYFSGDFSDNPVPQNTAYFKGIAWLQSFFYNSNQADDRREFFWRYYRPLLTSILRAEIEGTLPNNPVKQ